ncbi:MAG: DUF1549 domain-containing protein, partial [Planctomycetota bacterium]|nr:DUF1549 domain-containing protein [Planctomycetota bacterium]
MRFDPFQLNFAFHGKWRHACLSVLFGLMACLGVRGGESSPASSPVSDPAALEFFEREVRPLLIEKCQSCHNSEEANANLQFTDRESLLRGGDRGPAIVPGDPAASLLVVAVKYTDELQMPPKSRLSDAEIATLERWIALQAPWPTSSAGVTEVSQRTAKDAGFQASEKHKKWWAFQPVSRANPPVAASFPGWAQNEIDQFIAKELAANHLQPTSPADRRTWIRRATFDLTGLPPTPSDVEAFVHDGSPHAKERVVDRLLASPGYGERWGRHWLDVVRYADYYQENPKEHGSYRNFELLDAWRYRDWVVKSLNQDWPFDKFTKYHIAGDLIPSPQGLSYYEDGLVGTTFLTMGSWDHGDADKEKVISDIVDDQIDTIGKAFLGISFGCARCHDHKFDPVSNEDYYALAGIFYSTRTISDLSSKGDHTCLNRVPLAPPSVVQKRAEQVKQLSEIDAKIAELDKRDPKVAADDPQRVVLAAERKAIEGSMEPEIPVAMAVEEGGTPGG